MRPGGATDLGAALEHAADALPSDAPSATVLYLGDGWPTLGDTRIDAIRMRLARGKGGLPRLGAVAVGFLGGSLLPSTPVEDELLGALKGTLQARTQTMGAQAVEHGKAIIRDTLEAAQQSAQQHGADFAEEVRASV